MRTLRSLSPVALLCAVALCACTEGREVPEPLSAGDDVEARAVVERFFTAYVEADADQAVELLCERDAGSRAQASSFIRTSQAPGSRFRIQAFDVRKIEPSWDGTEPLFWVTVAFPRNSGQGELEQAYRVRAKDGCIERFLGGADAPPPSTKAPPVAAPGVPPSPPTPVEAPPATAPVGQGDDIIEL